MVDYYDLQIPLGIFSFCFICLFQSVLNDDCESRRINDVKFALGSEWEGCDTLKVMIIRHGKVDYSWTKWCTSEEFDKECHEYDLAPILPLTYNMSQEEFCRYYVSSLPRTKETAQMIFGDKEFITQSLIDEVPLSASIDTRTKMPLLFWNITGRLQWMMSSRKQSETRAETSIRAMRFVRLLIERNEDCAVVTHGFFMQLLLVAMKKQGFRVNRRSLVFDNGEYVIAER